MAMTTAKLQAVIAPVAVAVFMVGGVVWLWPVGSSPTVDSAVTACRRHVVDQLKAPSTAKFGQVRWERSGDTVRVSGAVDAENSFGALVRSDYTCTARRVSAASVLVEDFELTGRG